MFEHGYEMNNGLNKMQPWYKSIHHLVEAYKQRMSRTRLVLMEKFQSEKIVNPLMLLVQERNLQVVVDMAGSTAPPPGLKRIQPVNPNAKQFQPMKKFWREKNIS